MKLVGYNVKDNATPYRLLNNAGVFGVAVEVRSQELWDARDRLYPQRKRSM